jgi:hypothetical protein
MSFPFEHKNTIKVLNIQVFDEEFPCGKSVAIDRNSAVMML